MSDTAPLAILHVDMDAFYASVEQRDRPELRGRPVIVGGRPGQRGVVSAASYEARTHGVHSAMPMRTAVRLCPHGVFLPVRMDHYADVARHIRAVLLEFTALVEPLSLDEAFLDVKGSLGIFGSAEAIARQIKQRIRDQVGLTASVGVAPNKFLAKLASDLGKPDGLVVVPPQFVRRLLDPLPVGRLWGVGARGQARLHELGLRTIGQVAALPQRVLVDHFGEAGRHLWQLAQGQDDRPVTPDEEAKSLSTETTFATDVADRDCLHDVLVELVEHLGQRLRRVGVQGRTVELKARTSEFRTHSRSQTLAEPTDVTAVLLQTATGLLAKVPDDWLPLRLLGVGATGLAAAGPMQGHLFEQEWRAKQRSLDQAMDAIRKKFGEDSIGRAKKRRPPLTP